MQDNIHIKNNKPIALVIGLCSHGVAMTRALNRQGIEVHAFESDHKLPGIETNSATVHFISSIKSLDLFEELYKFRASIDLQIPIVLFPTNDVHVQLFSERMDFIRSHFLLSWQDCGEKIARLLSKENIEKRCEEVKLNYPLSSVVINDHNIEDVVANIDFPMIAKPVTPQSGFKAIKCESISDLNSLIKRYRDDLPILVQHWISGTDKDIYFAALYLDKGEVLASFVGQKLESFPLARGQTTVAVTCENNDVLTITEQFFEGLNLSGPVSLEVKKDKRGRYWIIEPTVGRTDFWVQLCVAAGCNLLALEYDHCIGAGKQLKNIVKPTIWFDSEKDISAFVRYFAYGMSIKNKPYIPTFSYLSYKDIKPFVVATGRVGNKLLKSAARRISNVIFKNTCSFSAHPYQTKGDVTIRVFYDIEQLPEQAIRFLDENSETVFCSHHWYLNFCKHIASKQEKIQFYCLYDLHHEIIAILPLWLKIKEIYTIKIRELNSLSNYYSPIVDIIVNKSHIDKSQAFNAIFDFLKNSSKNWDSLLLTPIKEDTKQVVSSSASLLGFSVDCCPTTLNYFLPVTDDYQGYFNGLSSRVRNTVTRQTKKLTKLGSWHIRMFTSENELDLALRQYHEIYNQSWKVKEPFPSFINGLVILAAKKNWLRLGILSINDEPVACQLWLVVNDNAYIYKLAYKKGFENYSPGTVLNNHMYKVTIDVDRVKSIDFLTGCDSYKKDWMDDSQVMYSIEVLNSGTLRGHFLHLKIFLSKLISKIKSYKNKN